jgi:hypothetical protein
VIVTANHYWLDGIVACLLVAAAAALVRADVPCRAVQGPGRATARAGGLVA